MVTFYLRILTNAILKPYSIEKGLFNPHYGCTSHSIDDIV
jgi:hypothetical protein